MALLEKGRSANIASIYMLLSDMNNAQRDAGLARLTGLQSRSSHALNFHLFQEPPAWVDAGLAEQATATLQAILTENNVTPLPEIHTRIFMEGDDFQGDAWARQVCGSAPVCSNPLLQLGGRLDEENWLNITQPLYLRQVVNIGQAPSSSQDQFLKFEVFCDGRRGSIAKAPALFQHCYRSYSFG